MVDSLERETTLFTRPGRDGYAQRNIVGFGQSLQLPEPFSVEIDTGVFDLDEEDEH